MWRDLGFRGYDTVYLVGPLTEAVLAGLPAAAVETARSEGLAGHADGKGRITRLADAADDLELIAAARTSVLPLGLVTAGDRAAVYLPHEVADGVEGTRILAGLLARAGGGGPSAPPPSLRQPLLQALRAGGRAAVRGYLAGRTERRALPDPGAPVERTDGRFARVTLDAAGVAAVRRTRSTGGRATPMSRVASIAIAALGDVASPGVDVRVVLPVDLRHLVGGHRVAGNFVSAEAYGTLRTTDWSPAGINRLLAGRRGTGAVALAAGGARSLLRRRAQGPVRPTLSLSLMGAVELPDVWAAGTPGLACATIGTAAGTFAFVAQVSDAISISVWDDTGVFAVDRFPDAFRAEVERRTARPAAGSPGD